MIEGIGETRDDFSKGNLELEIIIYRQLLSAAGIEASAMVISRVAEPIVHEETEKMMLRRQKKGPIGISKYHCERPASFERDFHLCRRMCT